MILSWHGLLKIAFSRVNAYISGLKSLCPVMKFWQVRVFQGKEPPQFLALFPCLIIMEVKPSTLVFFQVPIITGWLTLLYRFLCGNGKLQFKSPSTVPNDSLYVLYTY